MAGGEVTCIGVTGHRFLTDLDRVVAGIDCALDKVREIAPNPRYHILSSLAEGADRVVATRAMQLLGAELHAVLPLPRAQYEEDFKSAGSRLEFERLLASATSVLELPAEPGRPLVYKASGDYVVDHSDVMIAVWDGASAQGTGGVGDIVARARAKGKPLLIVAAGNRKPGTEEATSLGDRQGELTVELPKNRER